MNTIISAEPAGGETATTLSDSADKESIMNITIENNKVIVNLDSKLFAQFQTMFARIQVF